jgi:hypothetical protein
MGQGEGFGGAYCYAEGWVGLSRESEESMYVLKIMNIANWFSKSSLHKDDVDGERAVKRPCSNLISCGQDHFESCYQCISYGRSSKRS